MELSLLFFHLGSFLLGMTSAVVLLFGLASRRGADAAAGCLGFVICTFGVTLALFCYRFGFTQLA
jgi:hypothetical protein